MTTVHTRPAEAFQREGYVHLRSVFSGSELAALQEETLAQIEAGPHREPPADFVCGPGPDGSSRFYRINGLASKAMRNDSVLLAMMKPVILDLLAEIFVDTAVCWLESLIWKDASGGTEVSVHGSAADFPRTRVNENLNVGVYLDDVADDLGALRLAPGSANLGVDAARAVLDAGLGGPVMQPVRARAGDVVVHSEFTAHGSLASGPTPGGGPNRRIIYYAWTAAEQLIGPSVWAPTARPNGAAGMALLLARQAEASRRRTERYGEPPRRETLPQPWGDLVSAVDRDGLERYLGASTSVLRGRPQPPQ